MKIGLMSSLVALAMIGGAGAVWAQPANSSPSSSQQTAPTKQSAPPEAPQAAGHDAQTGQPETGPNATQSQNPSTRHDVDGTESKANAPPERK